MDRKIIVQFGLLDESGLKKMANNFRVDKEGHTFPKSLIFLSTLGGREKLPRDWLSSSLKNHKLYSLCRLFISSTPDVKHRSYLSIPEGFDPTKNKWHKIYRKRAEHERSIKHKQSYLQWRTLEHATAGGSGWSGATDCQIRKQSYRSSIRFLDVTILLGSRCLAFQGTSSKIGDIHNTKFLGCLELISHYDSLLEEHLKKVGKAKMKVSGCKLITRPLIFKMNSSTYVVNTF